MRFACERAVNRRDLSLSDVGADRWQRVKQFNITEPTGKFGDFQFRPNLRGGVRRLSVVFLNDYYKPDDPDPYQA